METRVLNYFLTIARLGTVSAAARELHIAQPTLSRQIQQLEEQLGAPLFNRERRRMTLTRAGMAYQLRVKQILAEINQANEVVASISNNSLTGTIRIGTVQSNIDRFVIPQLTAFRKENPGVHVSFYDADGEDIKERLDQGLLDIGFVSTPISTVKYHSRRLPVDDEWGIAVPSNDELANHATVSFQDLHDRNIIIPHRPLIKNELNDWLKPAEHHSNIIAEFNLGNSASYFAANSDAVLICIKGAPIPTECHLKFIPFQPREVQKHFMIWRKGITLSEASQRLINQILSQLSPQ